jgi:hypothetical protein
MTTATARANLKLRDQQVVELAVPAHMLILVMEQVHRTGYELRADVVRHLSHAAVLPFTKLDELSVARVARRVEDVATTMLRDLNSDDPRHALYVSAMFVLMLVDKGLYADVKGQAVLVSMLLIEDIKDSRPDVDGQGPVWRLEEQKWNEEAKKLLSRANLMGLYLSDDASGTVQLSA